VMLISDRTPWLEPADIDICVPSEVASGQWLVVSQFF
jgi:hypothetical protein